MATKEKIDIAKIVTDQIIEALEAGTVPWKQPWVNGQAPTSMSTGKKYRGVNSMLLSMATMRKGYDSPYWGTFNNISANGGSVRKGEKSTLVVFYKMLIVDDKVKIGEKKKIPMLQYFRVFNMEQADWPEGMPPAFTLVERPKLDPIEACELMVDEWDDHPVIRWTGDNAYYSPGSDTIVMPKRDQFDSSEHYYSTLFHEMTHSTGHAKRLKREGVVNVDRFGSHQYSKEELIAEMGAAMCAAMTGIGDVTRETSASYLASWIDVLKGDSKLIISAASAAQKAFDMITGEVVNEEEGVVNANHA